MAEGECALRHEQLESGGGTASAESEQATPPSGKEVTDIVKVAAAVETSLVCATAAKGMAMSVSKATADARVEVDTAMQALATLARAAVAAENSKLLPERGIILGEKPSYAEAARTVSTMQPGARDGCNKEGRSLPGRKQPREQSLLWESGAGQFLQCGLPTRHPSKRPAQKRRAECASDTHGWPSLGEAEMAALDGEPLDPNCDEVQNSSVEGLEHASSFLQGLANIRTLLNCNACHIPRSSAS